MVDINWSMSDFKRSMKQFGQLNNNRNWETEYGLKFIRAGSFTNPAYKEQSLDIPHNMIRGTGVGDSPVT